MTGAVNETQTCCCLFNFRIHACAGSSMGRIKSKTGDSLAFTGPPGRLSAGSVCGELSRLLAEAGCVDAGLPAAELQTCKRHISVWITPPRHGPAHQSHAARLDPSTVHGPQMSSQASSLRSHQPFPAGSS